MGFSGFWGRKSGGFRGLGDKNGGILQDLP